MCARDELEKAFSSLISALDPNPTRGGLQETPERAAKAYSELTSGHHTDPEDVLKVFEDGAEHYDGIVFQANIPVYTFCEHHVLPFFGVAHIGYIPNNTKIVGLSKLARLAEIFSKRLQVQERLTSQIACALIDGLNPKAVGVVLRCRHLCMEMRGVRVPGTVTYTSCLQGDFRDEGPARAEFMQLVLAADKDIRV